MKPTPKQILNFVESAGGIVRVMKALSVGADRVQALSEAADLNEAALAVAAQANDELRANLDEANGKLADLQTSLDEANSLVQSGVAQRRSGEMFRPTAKVDESKLHPHQRASLAKRLITGAR